MKKFGLWFKIYSCSFSITRGEVQNPKFEAPACAKPLRRRQAKSLAQTWRTMKLS
jgi:hypothetical protein